MLRVHWLKIDVKGSSSILEYLRTSKIFWCRRCPCRESRRYRRLSLPSTGGRKKQISQNNPTGMNLTINLRVDRTASAAHRTATSPQPTASGWDSSGGNRTLRWEIFPGAPSLRPSRWNWPSVRYDPAIVHTRSWSQRYTASRCCCAKKYAVQSAVSVFVCLLRGLR